MKSLDLFPLGNRVKSLVLIGALSAVSSAAPPMHAWTSYGRNAQHTALADVIAQPIQRIKWSTPVDLDPQYSGTSLLIHYGSPLVTAQNNVIVTVKTGAFGGFQIEGRRAADGALLYAQPTDYILPPQGWTPSCGSALSRVGQNKFRVFTPAAGGTVLMRADADNPNSPVTRVAFYGLANYNANAATYNSTVKINTPIVSDDQGNIYFGFLVAGSNPLNLKGGLAKIDRALNGSWIAATTMSGDNAMTRPVYNCAPAISREGGLVYIAVSGSGHGYLCAVDGYRLNPLHRVRLKDPRNNNDSGLPDQGTASPTIGPDGDVFFGVMGNPYNRSRGFLLHFNRTLTQTKIPGAFGWDDSCSIVPRSIVPSYTGPSSYLVLTKYNNYAGTGGDGVNKLAVLDPNTPMIDFATGATTMNDVLLVTGPTPDQDYINQFPNAVREWCINTAAVDNWGVAMVNSEDGKLYRWNLHTNQLESVLTLTLGIGEAYTPTVLGPDGTTYAINNAILFACGSNASGP